MTRTQITHQVHDGIKHAFADDPEVTVELLGNMCSGGLETEVAVTDEFTINVIYTDLLVLLQSGDIHDFIWVQQETDLVDTVVERIKAMAKAMTVIQLIHNEVTV